MVGGVYTRPPLTQAMISLTKAIALACAVASLAVAAPTNLTLEARQYVDGGVGQGTWYNVGLGACGRANVDSDMVVAVSWRLYDAYPGATPNPNLNPICNKQIQANYNGRSVRVQVVDKCGGCALTDLDFSPAAFSQLADPSVGRLFGVTWNWV